jgi:hypothetical protein
MSFPDHDSTHCHHDLHQLQFKYKQQLIQTTTNPNSNHFKLAHANAFKLSSKPLPANRLQTSTVDLSPR